MEWPLGQCFNFNSDVLCRTSSHIWGRWYLPMFLFRDGSLTLMNRASLIALVRFWFSLPTIVKLLMLTLWPEMLQWSYIGEGSFWCSLNLSAKVLADSLNVLFITPIFIAFISVYDSTFVGNRILVLWCHKEAFDGLSSFEVDLYPKFVAWFFDPLTKPLMIWNHHV